MSNARPSECDCCNGVSRRAFLKSTVAATALLPFGAVVEAADKKPAKTSETLVSEFYKRNEEPGNAKIKFSAGTISVIAPQRSAELCIGAYICTYIQLLTLSESIPVFPIN